MPGNGMVVRLLVGVEMILELHLEVLRIVARIDRVERMHEPFEREILRQLQYLSEPTEAESDTEAAYRDAQAEAAGELIEQLLGVAFAAAQTYLTSVRVHYVRISRALRDESGYGLLSKGDEQRGGHVVFGQGAEPMRFGESSRIEAINAVANYWKHHEEWPTCPQTCDGYERLVWDTESASPPQANTIRIIQELGMAHSGKWNMREAVRSFGGASPDDLRAIREQLSAWAEALIGIVAARVEGASGN